MIIRELKYFIFKIDEETKNVIIIQKETGQKIIFNKTYAFSLVRFLIRYFYRLSIKKRR